MIELLVMYGFDRVEFVHQPGQFSIRGGIIDIFSYGNDWPYRIEMFDIEVESIRTFNPTTQLSVQDIASVSIIPNINNKFKQEAAELAWLPPKDRPVPAAAIRLGCDALVTGDRRHFGSAFGRTVGGVAIHSPRPLAEAALAAVR